MTSPSTASITQPGTPVAAMTPPSTHIRALLTWIAIFPLVTLGSLALEPFTQHWPLPLRTLVLTLVVVPLAVYLVVPALMKARGAILRRRKRS